MKRGSATLFPLESCEEDLSLSDFCARLNISSATGKNWLKLGKIKETKQINGKVFFSKEYTDKILSELKDNKKNALKSRRNKKFISGNGFYEGYIDNKSKNNETVNNLINEIANNGIQLSNDAIKIILAEYATKLMCLNNASSLSHKSSFLLELLSGNISLNDCEKRLIDDLVVDKESAVSFIKNNTSLFDKIIVFDRFEDTLGLIYISLKNIGNRKAKGEYYTPVKVVDESISILSETTVLKEKNILDPCCGTGNFIIRLARKKVPAERIFACDIDETAIKVARINFYLAYGCNDLRIIDSHVSKKDFLESEFSDVDVIIGNPPWGADYSEKEKNLLRRKFETNKGKSVESFTLFIEKSLKILKKDGLLSFVLPESLLTVNTHYSARQFICDNSQVVSISYLGNAFHGVQCPSIILMLKKTNDFQKTISGIKVFNLGESFSISVPRRYSAESLDFSMNDSTYSLINKIDDVKNAKYLLNNSVFALGIVTGDNKHFLSQEQTEDNEPILKGSDISRYFPISCSNYINFSPSSYQQVAPVEYYRAEEKLLYKFISKYPIFCYDNKQTLSLNSCNILIPKIPDMDIKYVLAVLNSRIISFYYLNKFKSVKILRSHIEKLPIAQVDKAEQEVIIEMVDELLNKKDSSIYDELDKRIANIYNLLDEEYTTILNATNDDVFLLA